MQLRGRPHLLFLVHGYNNTGCEAYNSFERFCGLQSALTTMGQDWTFGIPIVEVFWPGDARWGLLKALFYPKALGVADEASELLSNVIRDLPRYVGGHLTVDFVTHSMGARVVLGAVSKLRGAPGVSIRRCVHMAAAMPVHRIDDPADAFRQGLLEEARSGQVMSFYSDGDDVLRFAFPPGESLDAANEGFMPIALGHEEWTPHHPVPNFRQRSAHPAGHGQYWNGASGLEVDVRDALAFAVAGDAVLPTRNIVTRSTDSRTTGGRDTASRTTGTQGISCSCK